MKVPALWCLCILFLFAVSSCAEQEPVESSDASVQRFEKRLPVSTGIAFANMLSEHPSPQRNVLLFEYFSNGSGIAVGDVNGDGLEDLYFVGNMSYNALYLNKGGLAFEDITTSAGVAGRVNTWKTGVTMADVNGDGLLDIYVCYSGDLPLDRRVDELYINKGNDENGIPLFEERAASFGLANPHSSNQAYFFDYDRDGDLDLFLQTHNVKNLPRLSPEEVKTTLQEEDRIAGVRFYRNDKNTFVDVTTSVGLSSSMLTYGLGTGISDINNDGWLDMYVGNDYSPPDYLYLNQQDGTFKDELANRMVHTSHASMGIDIADINNDGWTDVFVLDMLSEEAPLQKTQYLVEDRRLFMQNVASGFHHQYTRNTLQLNLGNGYFAETGQLAGIDKTDWSWTALIADFDNDGRKDIYVTNGVLRSTLDRDFLDYKRNYVQARGGDLLPEDIAHLMQVVPNRDITNYMFRNEGGLHYEDVSAAWGVADVLKSTGAVYSDLDLDGDLDLVTNNINEYAFVHENLSDVEGHHYLQVALNGQGGNTQGIGSRVTVYTGSGQQLLEQMPTRGYLSTVSPVLHFGLGNAALVDSLVVVWPTGDVERVYQVETNQRIVLNQENASVEQKKVYQLPEPILTEVTAPVKFLHEVQEGIDDFMRQPHIVHAKSVLGPALAKGDVNGDGLEDLFIGGGVGQASMLYMQRADGTFTLSRQPVFERTADRPDVDALFFDSNGDGNLDLYVVSGGYGTYESSDPRLQDRLYVNNGRGVFSLAIDALPPMPASTSSIASLDVNEDGAMDVFVGGYVVPGRYPELPRSYLLVNDGNGNFRDETEERAPGLMHVGMVTDAASADLNDDGRQELMLVGAWMPISVFTLAEGRLTEATRSYFDVQYTGLWNNLHVQDINADGQLDILAGNLGLNTQIKVNQEEPAELIYDDFNNDGSIDPLLTYYVQGTRYPFATLEALSQQLPSFAMQFPYHRTYGFAKVEDILPPEILERANRMAVNHLETSLFISGEDGRFEKKALPVEAQYAPVFSFLVTDINGDSVNDIMLAGNINSGSVRLGKYDASRGAVLLGKQDGSFDYVASLVSGFSPTGEVRALVELGDYLLVARRGNTLNAYSLASLKHAEFVGD